MKMGSTIRPLGRDCSAEEARSASTLVVTSDVLPPDQFPQFASESAGLYQGAAGPFDPVEGAWYVGGVHVNDSYMRLTREIDLGGVTAAQAPQLQAQISFGMEEGYDNLIVEAHPVGSDDWTTLPEAGGLTSTTPPTECEAAFFVEEHPFLLHYLTLGDPCLPTGTSGSWNAMTGTLAAGSRRRSTCRSSRGSRSRCRSAT
jgi:hypothetical protein